MLFIAWITRSYAYTLPAPEAGVRWPLTGGSLGIGPNIGAMKA